MFASPGANLTIGIDIRGGARGTRVPRSACPSGLFCDAQFAALHRHNQPLPTLSKGDPTETHDPKRRERC